jgi:proteasome alpha subunit
VLGPSTLEVAILDTNRPRRAFRRITGTALDAMLADADAAPIDGAPAESPAET